MSRAGSVVTKTTCDAAAVGGVELEHRRGEGAHHGRAIVGAVGVAEEDQREPLVGAGGERERACRRCRSARCRARGTAGAARAPVNVARPSCCRAAAPQPAASGQRAAGRAAAATGLATAHPVGEVLGERGQRLQRRRSGRRGRAGTRTKAEPTITPSAYDATSAAWSPLLTPRPTPTGRSVAAPGARDQRAGQVAGRGRAPRSRPSPRSRRRSRGRRRWSSRSARRSRTAPPGRSCRGRARRRRRSTAAPLSGVRSGVISPEPPAPARSAAKRSTPYRSTGFQ